MWSELTQLVEQRCQSADDPRALAEPLIAIYGALTNCQLAFARLEKGAASNGGQGSATLDERESDAALAIRTMIATLHNVQPVMQLFHGPDARDLAAHARSPGAGDDAAPEDRLRREVETLRQLLAVETKDVGTDISSLSAFSGAHRHLARLIADRYTLDDLFETAERQ